MRSKTEKAKQTTILKERQTSIEHQVGQFHHIIEHKNQNRKLSGCHSKYDQNSRPEINVEKIIVLEGTSKKSLQNYSLLDQD